MKVAPISLASICPIRALKMTFLTCFLGYFSFGVQITLVTDETKLDIL